MPKVISGIEIPGVPMLPVMPARRIGCFMARESKVALLALVALVTSLLVAPAVGAEPTSATARRMAIMTPDIIRDSKIVKRETNLTTGKSITTYTDGWVLTVTPGEASVPYVETFLGVPLTPIPWNCIGDYDSSQNAIVARAQAYNLQMARINATRSSNGNGRSGRGARIGPTTNTRVIIRNK